ncbi:MAG: hypothetical protein GY851_17785, partial [bacterium]|nr:hypothetical protein [bacterium]
MLAAMLAALGAMAEEPALPPGLVPEAPASDEAEPSLPPGLGGGESEEPGLPPGLGGDDDAPALPPGLGGEPDQAKDEASNGVRLTDRLPSWLHGYWEARIGARTQDDPNQPSDLSIAESRIQLKAEKVWDKAVLDFTGDFYVDGVMEDAEFDLRRLRLTFSPLDTVDVRVGRQVLTWGTGDLLFINDLFPKDWQSFFLGRDEEYLKAPSDAVKVGWYPNWVNVEVVYTPKFDPDRFIRGDRISYYNPIFGSSGHGRPVRTSAPDEWFDDDELALRIYRRVGRFEVALYGYRGFWKSPAGMSLIPYESIFPRLHVYGASARGQVGKGLLNVEMGYLDSRDDQGGSKFHINNSEFRFLVGYEREIGRELTGAVQYYLEHMMNHDAYEDSILFLVMPKRDENRHVVTVRLTKLLMNQNLMLSLFTYYSPSDQDAYVRPKA